MMKKIAEKGFSQFFEHKNIKKGIIQFENKEFKDCINTFDQIYEFNRANIVMNYYMGMSYLRLAQYVESAKYLEMVIKISKYPDVCDKIFFKKFGDKARGEMPGLSIYIKALSPRKLSIENEDHQV